MPAGKSLKIAGLVLAVVTVVVLLGWWAGQRGATHPEFGKIYTAEMSESYEDTQTKWEKLVITVRQHLHLPIRTPSRFGLPLGRELLGWSIHKNSPPNRDGWIYLRDVTSTGSHPMWEIALSEKRRLSDVSSKDFGSEFFGMDDPRGAITFGTNWHGAAFVVPEGQILLARLATNRSVIYVVHLAQQGGTPNYGSMKIEYVIATNQVAK